MNALPQNNLYPLSLFALCIASVLVALSFIPDASLFSKREKEQEIKNIATPAYSFQESGETKTSPHLPLLSKVPPPELSASAYLVRFTGDAIPLLNQREWKHVPLASLTKILTSVIALETLSPGDWITFSGDAKRVEEKLSSAREGEKFLRDDAIRFAMISSANDAATAIAEAVGEKAGGTTFQEKLSIFRDLMEKNARAIGLENSSFENPTGLDEDHHFSSAENLLTLVEYAWKTHPLLWEISRTVETVVYSGTGESHQISTTNDLLKELPGILGGKTGFTDRARGALVLIYPVKPDHIALITLLGSENRFEDGRKIIAWLEKVFQENDR